MIIKQICVFVENKPGRLAEITEIIGNAGVDLRALSIADTSDFGILRLIVDKPETAVRALEKENITVSTSDVIAVGIDDAPGAFAKVVRLMSENGVTIEYMYAFISRVENRAFVIMRIEDPAHAVEVLQQNAVSLLPCDAVYHM